VNSPNRASNAASLTFPIPTPDLVAVIVMALFAFVEGVALTQSDGDLFAHIRLGQIILGQHRIPSTSVLGFSFGTGAVYPAWLAAVWFALIHALGGLALIVASTAVAAGIAHGGISLFFRRRGLSPRSNLIASLLGLALASSHWLARPHEFSLLFSALLLLLLELSISWMPLIVGALFILWANLHGGWAFGLVLVACYVAGDALELARNSGRVAWRPRLSRDALAFACAVVASFCTPYGFRLHQAVLATLSDRSVATLINEYQPPGLSALPDILFFGVLAFSVLSIVASRRRPPFTTVVVLLVSTVFAMRAGRNIALFGIVAWPLIAVHLMQPLTDIANNSVEQPATSEPLRRIGIVAVPFAVVLLFLGVAHGSVAGRQLIPDSVDSNRFPTAAVDRLRAAGNQQATLTTWVWSGYVPFAWPGKRVFFDPLLFSPAILDEFGQMLLTQKGWREQVARQALGVVMLPPGVPLADSLMRDINWTQWHHDGTALVFIRRELPAADR
jgi:hypothetical protein